MLHIFHHEVLQFRLSAGFLRCVVLWLYTSPEDGGEIFNRNLTAAHKDHYLNLRPHYQILRKKCDLI